MYNSVIDNFYSYGNKSGPLVVCVHGIMGKSTDFTPFIQDWGKDFHLIIPELTPNDPKKVGYSEKKADGSGELLTYELAPSSIIEFLNCHYPGQKVFLMGISFGGKICFEVAQTIPERITGLCVTDVGLGPLCEDSDLFKLTFDTIPKLNLNQSWDSLRKEIASLIPDRMLRILIHNHIEYAVGKPDSGNWKSGANNFYQLLRNNKLENQWPNQDKLVAPCKILIATVNSAIDNSDFEKMKLKDNIILDIIEGANHFIHVHFPKIFLEKGLEMLNTFHQLNSGEQS